MFTISIGICCKNLDKNDLSDSLPTYNPANGILPVIPRSYHSRVLNPDVLTPHTGLPLYLASVHAKSLLRSADAIALSHSKAHIISYNSADSLSMNQNDKRSNATTFQTGNVVSGKLHFNWSPSMKSLLKLESLSPQSILTILVGFRLIELIFNFFSSMWSCGFVSATITSELCINSLMMTRTNSCERDVTRTSVVILHFSLFL